MTKNISKSAIDWAKFVKLVPPEQKVSFFALKAKNDGYLRRVHANPPTLPKINWDEFKKGIPDAALVDKFMSEYNSLKVPYPADTLSAEVDKQWKALQPEIKKYCDDIQAIIMKSKKELKRIHALPKFNEMTMEMYYDMFPDLALDPVNRPTFWPHVPDEQLGYKDPTAKVEH
ncbi:unnamed protein product [Arctia plantaginis]|uniref:ATP synthase subunit d, mitochondrial n=1 Tax=Arctia plantaginis TaxID=874455 RepID=A0A8S1AK60_ARCPL|nr:unnamed protein product [Arctia plantaginis]CAB3249139.1 unnamed protein product [Arctia plantaginis]